MTTLTVIVNLVLGALSHSVPVEFHPPAHLDTSMCLPAPGVVSPPNALYVQQHKGEPRMSVSGVHRHNNKQNLYIYKHCKRKCVNLKYSYKCIIKQFTMPVTENSAQCLCSYRVIPFLYFQVNQLWQKKIRYSLTVLDLEAGQGSTRLDREEY